MTKSPSKSASQILLGVTVGKMLNLITMVLVTPKLGPEGFGALAVAGMIMAIFTVIIDVGFENYYIVKIKLSGPDKTDINEVRMVEDIVFYVRLYSNLFLFSAQIAISYLLAGTVIHHPTDLFLRILAVNYLIAIFGKINEVRFRKQINFKYISYAKIISDFCGALSKLILIWNGYGLVGWAIGSVIGVFVNAVILTFKGRYVPHNKSIPRQRLKEVFWFAKHSWLTGLGVYFQQQISTIVMKNFFTLKLMGYFQFANTYTIDFYSQITSSQASWIIPYISNYQDNKKQLLKGLQRIVSTYLMVLGPTIIAGMVFSKELIVLVFNKDWLFAQNMVIVFLAFILIRASFSPGLGILTALGKMKQSSMVSIIGFVVLLVLLFCSAYFTGSIFTYAAAYAVAMLISDIIKCGMGLKFLDITWLELLSCTWIHVKIFLALFLFYMAAKIFFVSFSILLLGGVIIAGLLLYAWAQYTFNKAEVLALYDTVKNIIRRKKPAIA